MQAKDLVHGEFKMRPFASRTMTTSICVAHPTGHGPRRLRGKTSGAEEAAEKLDKATKKLIAGAKAQHIFNDLRHD